MSLVINWISDACFFSQGAFFWICDFIECQLDFLYLGWVLSLLKPALLTIFILPISILFMLYFSSLLLYIYTYRRSRMREVLHESLNDPWVGGRYLISLLWDAHGYIWHGYDLQGLEHMPQNKGGLIVYYHGAIPIDVYYLVARIITSTGRHIHCVGDRFLQKIPGWQSILEAFRISPCSVSDCVKTVNEGHLLAVSPGGVREAQFSDHSYTLLWGSRRGFAKVAIQANCPIIPMFSRNLREAFRVVSFPSMLWNALYTRFKLPFAPIYGGFPVKLVSYLGPCIYPLPGESADHLAGRVERAVYGLIAQHQRLPGNILAALLDRLHPCIAPSLLGPGTGTPPPHALLAEEGEHEENLLQQNPLVGREVKPLKEVIECTVRESEGAVEITRVKKKETDVMRIVDAEHGSGEVCEQMDKEIENAEQPSRLENIKELVQTLKQDSRVQQDIVAEDEETVQERPDLPAADSDACLKTICQTDGVPKRIELTQPLQRISYQNDGKTLACGVHLEQGQVEHHIEPLVIDEADGELLADTYSTHFNIDDDDASYLETARRKDCVDVTPLPTALTLEVSTSADDEKHGDSPLHAASSPSQILSAAISDISPIQCSYDHEARHKFSENVVESVQKPLSSRENPCISLMESSADADTKSSDAANKSIIDDATQLFKTDLSDYSHVAKETPSLTSKSGQRNEDEDYTTNVISAECSSLSSRQSHFLGGPELLDDKSPETVEDQVPSVSGQTLEDGIPSVSGSETVDDRIPSVGGLEAVRDPLTSVSGPVSLNSGVEDEGKSGVLNLPTTESLNASLRSRVESELSDAMQPIREPTLKPNQADLSTAAAAGGFVRLSGPRFSGSVVEETSNDAGEFETVAAGDDSEPSTTEEDGRGSSIRGGSRDGSSDSDGRSSGSSFELLSTTKSSSSD